MCAQHCMRVCVCVWMGARVRTACEHSAPPSTVEFVGLQAFNGSTAFNADISKWNTAAVTYMAQVCAAFGPGVRHHGGGARSVFDAARPSARRHHRRCRARVGVSLSPDLESFAWMSTSLCIVATRRQAMCVCACACACACACVCVCLCLCLCLCV
jgi:surface protein